MNNHPANASVTNGGPILPYQIVGFGDDSWGLMDGRSSDYALVRDDLRLFSKASDAEALAVRIKTNPSLVKGHVFGFGPLRKPDGTARKHNIL